VAESRKTTARDPLAAGLDQDGLFDWKGLLLAFSGGSRRRTDKVAE
jgi:hypothetical protein